MDLKFHVVFFEQLDFRQIEFFIETRFSKNSVSKHWHFVGTFGRKGYFAIFGRTLNFVNHPIP